MKKYLCIAAFLVTTLGFAQINMEVASFSKIKIDANANVEIVYSYKDQVMFTASEEQLKNFSISSENNTLTIQQNGSDIPGLRIRIFTNSLKAIALNGNGNMLLSKFTFLDSLYLSMKGSYITDLSDATIENLVISRDANSKAIFENAKKVQESINGTLQE
ncbi:MAG: GIN domain-containing protein [Nonlabens sp.]|uniref:GIN domain-containing protein n=1 Tax=Nonlabens sp. TaxID=1888209 RepID=UPI003EF60F36